MTHDCLILNYFVMRDFRRLLLTAVTPMLWGTTYLVTTTLLPPGRPLLAGLLRALPAGMLMSAALLTVLGRRALPHGAWWWRSALLGTLNIGLFFPLLFVAAYRLPGGVAAVAGALGPFAVAGLSFVLLGQRVERRLLVAAVVGVGGVALLVLRSQVALDPWGLLAAAAGTMSMSTGTVLGRRWGIPDGFTGRTSALIALTGWQLTAGGLVVLPLTLAVEGLPPPLTLRNLVGFSYLSLVGTALAYVIWFGGVTRLAPVKVTLLALLSPLVAAVLGWVVLDQTLAPTQMLGALAVLLAVGVGTTTISAWTGSPASAVVLPPSAETVRSETWTAPTSEGSTSTGAAWC